MATVNIIRNGRSINTQDLNTILCSLMTSEEFRNSSEIITVPEYGQFRIADLFVNWKDITDEQVGGFHGFWGKIPNAQVTGNTMWLNSGGPTAPCANIDQKHFEAIYQRFNIDNAAEISGAHILVFGELK